MGTGVFIFLIIFTMLKIIGDSTGIPENAPHVSGGNQIKPQ